MMEKRVKKRAGERRLLRIKERAIPVLIFKGESEKG